ncbi:hypothetical protein V5799_007183, partial [Amblyomma americanum]
MLCDLAGSEKPSKSGADWSWRREAGRINTSLMVLIRCLDGLRRNKDAAKKVPLPFRESKLTKALQTDRGAAAEQEAEAQLAAAGVELQSLRCLREEMSSQLACEVQAPSDADDSAQQAHEELSTVSENLAEEVAHNSCLQQRIEQVERDAVEALQHASSELCEELEQLRRHIEEHELSLRNMLDDKDDALREAELSLHAVKEDLEREVAVRMAAEERCSKLAIELEDTTESACEAKPNVQSCIEKANANLSLSRGAGDK